MAKHEHFETLCAAASLGQASGEELARLQKHLAECSDCQQAYSDFVHLNAAQCATGSKEQQLSGEEVLGYIDSAMFREKFLKKAEAEGIVFSRDRATVSSAKPPSRPSSQGWRRNAMLPVAASLLLVVGGVAGYGLRRERRSATPADRGPSAPASVSVPSAFVKEDRVASISRLQEENRRLASEIASLRNALAHRASELDQAQASTAVLEKERAAVVLGVKESSAKIEDLQRQLAQAQGEAESARNELAATRESNQAGLVADQIKIREIADQLAEQASTLARERGLLSANRDIRDLIAARNLHIADVFDTDSKGKTRSAFGRVFFTEGKSLIIYAYDLNDRRVQDAGYHYRVWGKKEGPGQAARSLGMFYSDDTEQKRWLFRYDDPKVLSEIDSVFVTLEPPGKNSTEPKGDKFLYAYLRNEANHP